MMHVLKKITKQTNNKYLNLYAFKYDNNIEYYVASRRNQTKLSASLELDRTDAVRVLAYFYDNEKLKVVLNKEFRYPVNRYIYQLPAGLIENGEKEEDAAVRELGEEIGAKVLSLIRSENPGYVSAGMTDERLSHFWAHIELSQLQHLDKNEDIQLFILDFEDILNFIETHEMGLVSKMQLKAFYYEIKYKKLIDKDFKLP